MIFGRIKRAVTQLMSTLLAVSFAGALAGCTVPTTSNDAEETTSAITDIGADGAIIRIDANSSLAMGATLYDGAEVRLLTPCADSTYPNLCFYNDRWIYREGMLLAAANTNFAIRVTRAEFGAQLKVGGGCTPQMGECTWTLTRGTFISNAGWGANLRAWGGYTASGNIVTLHNGCQENYADCTWTMRDVMITDSQGTSAFDNFQLNTGTQVRLRTACTPNQPDCRWTISHGQIIVANSAKANIGGRPPSPIYPSQVFISAGYVASEGAPLKLDNGCFPSTSTACTWTFGSGWIRSDLNWDFGAFPVGGVTDLAPLNLTAGWQIPVNNVVVR